MGIQLTDREISTYNPNFWGGIQELVFRKSNDLKQNFLYNFRKRKQTERYEWNEEIIALDLLFVKILVLILQELKALLCQGMAEILLI